MYSRGHEDNPDKIGRKPTLCKKWKATVLNVMRGGAPLSAQRLVFRTPPGS